MEKCDHNGSRRRCCFVLLTPLLPPPTLSTVVGQICLAYDFRMVAWLDAASSISLWVSLFLVLLNLQMNELLSSSLVVADDAVVSTITAGAPRFGQCCLWLLAKWLSSLFLLLLFVCLPVRVPHFVYKNRKNCLRVVWETSTMNSLENVNVSLVWWFRTFKERGIMKHTHNTDHKKADWLQSQCIEPALSLIKILWIL